MPVWLVLFFSRSDLAADYCPAEGAPWWLLFIIAPVLEELVFRGLLQGEFGRTKWGKLQRFGVSFANVLTSALFVLAHGLRMGLGAWTVLLPSLILGWLKDRCGSVVPCIVVHALFNAGLVLALGCG